MHLKERSNSFPVVMLVMCAVFAALTAICSQLQIPLPAVPINLALFAVHLSGAVLGPKFGGISMGVYVLLGLMGVPVFAGFAGGVGILFGKTGGYILGYILDAIIVGLLVKRWGCIFWKNCLAMVIGLAVCYAFGTIWFMILTGMNLWMSLVYCVFPFLIGDAIKIILASYLAVRLKRVIQ